MSTYTLNCYMYQRTILLLVVSGGMFVSTIVEHLNAVLIPDGTGFRHIIYTHGVAMSY